MWGLVPMDDHFVLFTAGLETDRSTLGLRYRDAEGWHEYELLEIA